MTPKMKAMERIEATLEMWGAVPTVINLDNREVPFWEREVRKAFVELEKSGASLAALNAVNCLLEAALAETTDANPNMPYCSMVGEARKRITKRPA